jgi:hypothetical protein
MMHNFDEEQFFAITSIAILAPTQCSLCGPELVTEEDVSFSLTTVSMGEIKSV